MTDQVVGQTTVAGVKGEIVFNSEARRGQYKLRVKGTTLVGQGNEWQNHLKSLVKTVKPEPVKTEPEKHGDEHAPMGISPEEAMKPPPAEPVKTVKEEKSSGFMGWLNGKDDD